LDCGAIAPLFDRRNPKRRLTAAIQSGDQSPQAKTGPNSTSPYLTPDI